MVAGAVILPPSKKSLVVLSGCLLFHQQPSLWESTVELTVFNRPYNAYTGKCGK
jgi:hypothetical protein